MASEIVTVATTADVLRIEVSSRALTSFETNRRAGSLSQMLTQLALTTLPFPKVAEEFETSKQNVQRIYNKYLKPSLWSNGRQRQKMRAIEHALAKERSDILTCICETAKNAGCSVQYIVAASTDHNYYTHKTDLLLNGKLCAVRFCRKPQKTGHHAEYHHLQIREASLKRYWKIIGVLYENGQPRFFLIPTAKVLHGTLKPFVIHCSRANPSVVYCLYIPTKASARQNSPWLAYEDDWPQQVSKREAAA